MADSRKKEDFGTRVFNAATMMAASFVARKAITLGLDQGHRQEAAREP